MKVLRAGMLVTEVYIYIVELK